MNLNRKIGQLLDNEVLRILNSAGTVAQETGVNIYLVGGTVRDLLLNTPGLDIDIAVEGDAIEFAGKIVQGGKVTYYPDFGTATIAENHLRIDLVMTRSETYKEPGALPDVIPGDIRSDLLRRDFTINAMAVSLNPERFGELIDPYKGYSDLKDNLIRVLHKKSFSDDPTRIWRAIRYEQRLGFTIETNTLKLLGTYKDTLKIISGERIRHELELVLKEKAPEKVLLRSFDLHVLNLIHRNLHFNEQSEINFKKARASGVSDAELLSLYFALLFYDLKDEEVQEILSRLHFNRIITKNIMGSQKLKNLTPELSRNGLLHSEIYSILHEYSVPAIIAVYIGTDLMVVKTYIKTFLTKLKDKKTRLNGDDLKKMGVSTGVEINNILRALLKARLDNKVTTKQSEIRFVFSNFDFKPK